MTEAGLKARLAGALEEAEIQRNRALDLQEKLEAVGEERDRLQAKLDHNRCNSGHVTLPLALWNCPTCTDLERERLGNVCRDLLVWACQHLCPSGVVFNPGVPREFTCGCNYHRAAYAAVEATKEWRTRA